MSEQEMREKLVHQLLVPIWRGIPASYKSDYRSNIWQQLQDNIITASNTSSLSLWYSRLCKALNVTVRTHDTEGVEAVLGSGNDRAILKMLRKETATLVVMVQVINEQRKGEWRQSREEVTDDPDIL